MNTQVPERTPAISVIVVNWNGRHLLPGCLASLTAQSWTDFELILVDNGSTDGSADWVAEHFPAIHLIRLDRNLGFSGGNNVGLRAARGEFIALLNNDAEAAPTWLAELHGAMVADPQVAACDSRVCFFDTPEILWAAGADYAVSGSVTHRGYLQATSAFPALPHTEVFVAIACAAMYRRSALDCVGFFDEEFFSGYEDVDLSFRLQLAGYRVLTVPAALVIHRVSETARINSWSYVYHGQKNVLYTFLKNMPSSLLMKYLPLHLFYTLGSLVYYARQRQFFAALRGKLAVLRQYGSLVRKRREVQRLRVVNPGQLEQRLSRDWFWPKMTKLKIN